MRFIVLQVLVTGLVIQSWATTDPCQNIPKSTIHTIEFVGLEYTDSIVVQRELHHTAHTTFICKDFKTEKQKLMSLDIFSDVTLSHSVTNDSLALTYTFKEMPPFLILPAVSKTDQDGWRIGATAIGFNLWGRDVAIGAFVRYGLKPTFADVSEYMLLITSPWLFSIPLEYQILYLKSERYNMLENFQEDSHMFQSEFQYPVYRNIRALFGGRILNMHSNETRVMYSGKKREHINKAYLGVAIDGRNARFNPYEGYYSEFRVSQAGGSILRGDNTFTEYLLDLRAYVNPVEHHLFRVYGLGEYRDGYMSDYVRLHAGGMNTITGYNNTEFKAQSEILVTAEYAYEFFHHKSFSLWNKHFFLGLQAVTGFDYGSFWLDSKNRNGYSWYSGIHLLVPGAERIRFEISQELTRYSINFSVGFFEKSTTRRWHVR